MKLKFFPVQGPDDGAGAGGAGAADAGAAAAAGGGKGAGAGAGAAAGDAKGGGAAADGKGAGAGAGDAAAAAAASAGADGKGAGGAGAPVWDADHWRATWAGADDKKKAWAERRTDLKIALDSAYAADQKIAELSATAKTVLPKDATAEQIATWRKDNGIPEKAEGYIDALSKDVSDDAKAVITPYLSALHEMNVSPATAAKLVTVLQAERVRHDEARVQADDQLRVKTEDALRADWGNNYRAEINNIQNLLKGAPDEVRDGLMNARTPDGKAFIGTPEALRWLAQLARTVSPYSVPVGGDGGLLDSKGVDARIAEIDGWMGATRGSPDYKKYFDNVKVQEEYRQLIDAKDQLKRRTAA